MCSGTSSNFDDCDFVKVQHLQAAPNSDLLQARAFLLRSGLLRLRLWIRLAECRRDRRLKASNHRNHVVVKAKFNAWKNKLYPLGLRVQWSPKAYPHTNAYNARGPKDAGTHTLALRLQGMERLEQTEAERAQDLKSSSGYASLALLRLPMIRRRLRRMLFVWRRKTEKEMRFRYIRGTLPQKVIVCALGVY